MGDKPKMYQNRSNKIFTNNKEVYMSSDRNTTNYVFNSNDIRKKINDIVNSSSFIYRTKVNIVIGNEIIKDCWNI